MARVVHTNNIDSIDEWWQAFTSYHYREQEDGWQ